LLKTFETVEKTWFGKNVRPSDIKGVIMIREKIFYLTNAVNILIFAFHGISNDYDK